MNKKVKKSFIRVTNDKESTNEFIEGVINRVNEIHKNQSPVIDLNKIKEMIYKKKTSEVIEVINLNNDNNNDNDEQLLSNNDGNEDEVKIITDKEFIENVMSNAEKYVKPEGAFNCLICFKNKVLVDTRKFECGHEFCNKCATRWMRIKSTCPVCRYELYKW